jgi:hypothetical protein
MMKKHEKKSKNTTWERVFCDFWPFLAKTPMTPLENAKKGGGEGGGGLKPYKKKVKNPQSTVNPV